MAVLEVSYQMKDGEVQQKTKSHFRKWLCKAQTYSLTLILQLEVGDVKGFPRAALPWSDSGS